MEPSKLWSSILLGRTLFAQFLKSLSHRQGIRAINDLEIQASCHICDTTFDLNHGSFNERATGLFRHSAIWTNSL